VVTFPPVSPPRPYTLPSPHPYAPHAQPISLFSILSPAQYWVRSTDHNNNNNNNNNICRISGWEERFKSGADWEKSINPQPANVENMVSS